MDIYKVIGLMSGTSLDGLDMAYCLLVHDKTWSFTIERAETIAYDVQMRKRLQKAASLDADELTRFHFSFGHFMGERVREFIAKHRLQPDLIASHGHTVFHQPKKGYTLQIGDGNAIATETRLPVVYDFRSLDVALGGQGAPLVPLGDRLLFSEYAACLNLGGIANISYEKQGMRRAFDVCPANMVLNKLAGEKGWAFDDRGKIARSGKLIRSLLDKLNALPYYQQQAPKSLGKEWLEQHVFPLLDTDQFQVNDLLHTLNHHIAEQIAKSLDPISTGKLIITGGGAYNDFLIDLLREKSQMEIVLPSKSIIDYKEALIFALLGVLRLRDEVNTLASVSGASADSCGGVIAGSLGK